MLQKSFTASAILPAVRVTGKTSSCPQASLATINRQCVQSQRVSIKTTLPFGALKQSSTTQRVAQRKSRILAQAGSAAAVQAAAAGEGGDNKGSGNG